MKAARFHAPGDIRIEDVPEPAAGPGEVRLRVRNCSTCGTDVKISRAGHQNLSPPRTMGHEIAGEVDRVGDGVTGWAVGDRVQVIAAIPDGTCVQCRKGRPSVCANQESMGYQYDGGFAQYMTVPAKVLAVDGLNRIPDELTFAEASVAEPVDWDGMGEVTVAIGIAAKDDGQVEVLQELASILLDPDRAAALRAAASAAEVVELLRPTEEDE